ncbi:MAG: hypothetical protein ACOH2F_13440 [Cellulomonas sp.]
MSDNKDTTAHDVIDARPTGTTEEFLGLLAEHVPLALLADLAAPSGPGSSEILRAEGLPDDAWWESNSATPAPAEEPSPA